MRIRTNRTRLARGLIACMCVLVAVLTFAPPAFGDHCSGSGSVRDRGGEVIGECHENGAGSAGSTGGGGLWAQWCVPLFGDFQEGDRVEFMQSDPLVEGDIAELGLDPSGEYWWWAIWCYRGDDGVSPAEIVVEVGTAPVSPEALRDSVTARLDPPLPAPSTSPPVGEQAVVQVPTWLWLESDYWRPVEESESVGSVSVRVRATPIQAVWLMGDGHRVVCNGPGTPWTSGLTDSASDCSHTYRTSSYATGGGMFEASVVVSWQFEWWLNGVPQGGFGSVEVAAPFEVAVGEVQAIERGG